MDNKKPKILYVEDDVNLGFVTKDNLTKKGYDITLCEDGLTAAQTFQKQKFDLCILDVMLPKIDGFALAQKFRDKDKNVPILFLTAKAMLEDKLQGFKLGGDDYITKPFSIDELVLKIEVFLKRSKVFTESAGMEKNTYDIAAYVFDFKELTLTNGKNTYTLTIREAELLRMLTINRNQVVRRESILHQVWGEDNYYIGRSLDVFVSRLRKMFADEPNVEIENVRGVGFKFIVKE
ncbi:MAG: response regulator transcription factor [Chitinophagales bacterium]|jgi:two-component system response regulator VicR|nr:response regulator transcription factor [Bacteroidota bacterium]MBK9506438.1 response regulator transcription factor [Bacteroidota bacterium]MBK9557589.1 response regulator transcription factor [Bacteroidota bacterium]MBL0280331.1 response regulator transcription factor [Bacteroidota bacterium]MBP9881727.1 response regulator transcription factor [Chitinophagales bacterium]